ncbi:nuclear transport factor 2 family protein [Chitinimonas koreensis]|uniref:nuclear transport factor 2 family protein n=1 Tax=Chitinimonas koreensis TaxID=356302 RepID=UPI00048D631D|nr:nuclear transport factor 2 family protein [Chitinimonas koreensis]QNM95971.1 nuclear transport factor 2 family protein [Chitinimonas koreensis]
MNKQFAAILVALLVAAIPATATADDRFAAETAAMAPVADAYFEAYIRLDWDHLEPLLADDANFRDPTSALVFGGVGAEGKAAMMRKFRTAYTSLRQMGFTKKRIIHSGNFALYEGDLSWTVDMGDGRDVSSVTPIVIVLEVRGGKVVSHRDYVDYAPFLAAERATRPAKK